MKDIRVLAVATDLELQKLSWESVWRIKMPLANIEKNGTVLALLQPYLRENQSVYNVDESFIFTDGTVW